LRGGWVGAAALVFVVTGGAATGGALYAVPFVPLSFAIRLRQRALRQLNATQNVEDQHNDQDGSQYA
jgi:hypothetical protein